MQYKKNNITMSQCKNTIFFSDVETFFKNEVSKRNHLLF